MPAGTSYGRGTLEVTVTTTTATTTLSAAGVWHLPTTGASSVRGEHPDPGLAARLGALAASFPGDAGIWVHELRTGRTAGWNDDARFPAASTVKLGVLARCARRLRAAAGALPAASRHARARGLVVQPGREPAARLARARE